MNVTRTLGSLGAAASLLLAGVACGGEEGTGRGAADSPDSSSSSASAGQNESKYPADWQVASTGPAQFHLSPDWKLATGTRDHAITMKAPLDSIGASPGAGTFLAGPNGGEGEDTAHIEELGDLREESLRMELGHVKRLPNETFGGSVFYHIQGESDRVWRDNYGTVVPGGEHLITVSWDFHKTDIDRKGADALIAQVMKTYEPTP